MTKTGKKVIKSLLNSLLPLLKKKHKILTYRQTRAESVDNINLEHFLETYDSDNDSDFEPYSKSFGYNTEEDYLYMKMMK